MNKLHTLYAQILEFAGIKIENDGRLTIDFKDRQFPAEIGGKRMVMPYDEILRQLDSEKEIVFHPFQEFINRGESDVVRKLRRIINIRLNIATLAAIDAMMEILSNPALHAKMSPQQREVIKSVGEVDGVLRGKFMALATTAFAENPDALFVNIYTKKSGVFKGNKHARVGVVTFPIYESTAFAGTKLGKKGSWETILQIINFVFPGSQDDAEAYNSYSDSTDCPWLDCLLRTAINVTERLNEIVRIYGNLIDGDNLVTFNMDWVDGFDNLNTYKKEIALIPSQRGNEGEIEAKATNGPAAALSPAAVAGPATLPATAPVQPAVQMQPQQPAEKQPLWGDAIKPIQPPPMPVQYGQQPAPATMPKPDSSGKVKLDDLISRPPQMPMQQPMMPQYPMDPRYGYAPPPQQDFFPSPITAMYGQRPGVPMHQPALYSSPTMAMMAGGQYQPPPQQYPMQQYPQQGYPQQAYAQPYQAQAVDAYGRPVGAIPGVAPV